jgi:hypothetical protein
MRWFEKSKSFEKNAENALKMELYDIEVCKGVGRALFAVTIPGC